MFLFMTTKADLIKHMKKDKSTNADNSSMTTITDTPRAKWRDLGPDEVIQKGDEVESYPPDTYIKVGHPYIGQPVSSSSRRFRTRRPLPEVASTNADNSSMTTITDTPRTDAEVFPIQDCNGQLRYVITTQFAKQLERELNESNDNLMRTQIEMQLEIDRGEAEIEHIKTLLKDPSAVHINTLRGTIAGLSWDGYEHILGPHPCRERAEKAEKKLEVAQKQLKRAVEIAETSCRYLDQGGENEDELYSGKEGWVTDTEINEVCASLSALKEEIK